MNEDFPEEFFPEDEFIMFPVKNPHELPVRTPFEFKMLAYVMGKKAAELQAEFPDKIVLLVYEV